MISSHLVVSVDELRALHRLAGLYLPGFVADEDDARVDVAAVRGLVARNLAALPPDGSMADAVFLTGPLEELLVPCRAARWIAEIDVEAGGVLDRHAVIADDTAAVVASERPGGMVGLWHTATGPHTQDSFHYRQRAFDANGSPNDLARFANWAADHYGKQLTELFWNGPGARNIDNGQPIPPGTVPGHTDHVHIAM